MESFDQSLKYLLEHEPVDFVRFALKGEAMDGHRFIEAAFAKGAVAAIVDRPVDFPHVLVADTVD